MTLVWLIGTRNIDFLKTPSEEKLAAVRKNALPPPPAPPAGTTSTDNQANERPAIVPPAPPLDLGNLSVSPALSAYRSQAEKNPAQTQAIACALEDRKAKQRALLAWERLVDTAKSDDDQQAAAFSSIRRIRPSLHAWNIDPAGCLPIRLHLATSPSVASKIQPTLQETASTLAAASSGIIQVDPVLSVGKQASELDGNPPIAMWLSGPTDQSRSTDVLSFQAPGQPDQLLQAILRTIYRLTASYLAHMPQLAAPTDAPESESPAESLTYRITRLAWWEFAKSLALPQPAAPAAPATQ